MILAVENRVTADDYRSLPENGDRYQLIEGDLHMAPAPNRFHQEIALNIVMIIAKYLETHPIGKIFIAPFDVYLNDGNVFQPDLVYIARENFGVLTEAGVEGVPDLVVEILSVRTASLDRNPKRRLYAQSGVKELWLVDPETVSVTVHHLQEALPSTAVYSTAEQFTSDFFPELLFSVGDIFKR
jgi:Uma2 family endonuclease